MSDNWAKLTTFQPSAGLDKRLSKTRSGQRANQTKLGTPKRLVEDSIHAYEREATGAFKKPHFKRGNNG